MGTGRAPCCDKKSVKKGPWSPAEDLRLAAFIQKNGHGNWRSLPKQAGLMRCGKSCRLRWINYLSPNVKRGNFTLQEEEAIIKLHNTYGNKWSKIAAELPGRTDNEIKNVWNTHLKKRLLVDKNSKCHNNNYNNAKQKNYYKASSASATSNSCGGVQSQEDKRQITSDYVVEMQIQNCTMSRSSSFTSNASNFSSSTTQVCDQVEKPSKEVEPLLGFSEDIIDHEFDIWSVLEDFDKFEAQHEHEQQQQQQLVASHLQGLNFEDENYIINHDMELAEKSEWYRYLENNELGLMAIIGDQNQNFSQNEQATNGLFEEMRLEPDVDLDMNWFQYCPPSPHYI